MIAFVSNPYTGQDLRSFIATENDGTGAADGDFFEFGDLEVMDAQSWSRLERFMKNNPIPPKGHLSFTKFWIHQSHVHPFGPNEATAYANYLDDLTQAIQGKPTSGTNHDRAIQEGAAADKSKAQKKVGTDG